MQQNTLYNQHEGQHIETNVETTALVLNVVKKRLINYTVSRFYDTTSIEFSLKHTTHNENENSKFLFQYFDKDFLGLETGNFDLSLAFSLSRSRSSRLLVMFRKLYFKLSSWAFFLSLSCSSLCGIEPHLRLFRVVFSTYVQILPLYINKRIYKLF